MIKRFQVYSPFATLERTDIQSGMSVYYTLSRKSEELHGPFQVELRGELGFGLLNGQNVWVSLDRFPTVQFWRTS